SSFGFDPKPHRVTGFLRCDARTTRLADKSALIEDDEYTKFDRAMRTFVIDTAIPSLTAHEDVLITRGEHKIYREIDEVLGQAMVETLELEEEVQGYEMVEVKERVKTMRKDENEDEDKRKGRAHSRQEEVNPLVAASSGMSKSGQMRQQQTV